MRYFFTMTTTQHRITKSAGAAEEAALAAIFQQAPGLSFWSWRMA
jgi:hypothetical protein